MVPCNCLHCGQVAYTYDVVPGGARWLTCHACRQCHRLPAERRRHPADPSASITTTTTNNTTTTTTTIGTPTRVALLYPSSCKIPHFHSFTGHMSDYVHTFKRSNADVHETGYLQWHGVFMTAQCHLIQQALERCGMTGEGN